MRASAFPNGETCRQILWHRDINSKLLSYSGPTDPAEVPTACGQECQTACWRTPRQPNIIQYPRKLTWTAQPEINYAEWQSAHSQYGLIILPFQSWLKGRHDKVSVPARWTRAIISFVIRASKKCTKSVKLSSAWLTQYLEADFLDSLSQAEKNC